MGIQELIMINLLVLSLVFVYLIMIQRVFKLWFRFFEQDTTMSFEEKQLGWVILVIGATFWAIVVPISYLTLLEKKLEQYQVIEEEDQANNEKYYSHSLPTLLISASGK
jgi:hypothetical protein